MTSTCHRNKLFTPVMGMVWLTLSGCMASANITATTTAPQACTNSCVTPYGTVLGSNNSVAGYSNCNTNCISNQDKLLNGIYTGMSWQCMEYSRRWLQSVESVSFGGVDAANDIWQLPLVVSIQDNSITYPFFAYKNGGTTPPVAGDLIIYAYEKVNFPYGHVGVIVNVNTQLGYADIAEQNYTNNYWEDPQRYARRIILSTANRHYTLVDRDYNPQLHVSINGTITGWKHIQK